MRKKWSDSEETLKRRRGSQKEENDVTRKGMLPPTLAAIVLFLHKVPTIPNNSKSIHIKSKTFWYWKWYDDSPLFSVQCWSAFLLKPENERKSNQCENATIFVTLHPRFTWLYIRLSTATLEKTNYRYVRSREWTRRVTYAYVSLLATKQFVEEERRFCFVNDIYLQFKKDNIHKIKLSLSGCQHNID